MPRGQRLASQPPSIADSRSRRPATTNNETTSQQLKFGDNHDIPETHIGKNSVVQTQPPQKLRARRNLQIHHQSDLGKQAELNTSKVHPWIQAKCNLICTSANWPCSVRCVAIRHASLSHDGWACKGTAPTLVSLGFGLFEQTS